MIDPEDLLSEFDRLGTEPCWCGTWDEGGCPSCNLTMSVRRKVEALCRERDDAIGRSSKWADIAGEHGAEVDELRRENQILKEDCERLRQYGNRDCIAMAEADDDEATLTPEQQKTLYRENMRLSGKWPSAPIKDKPWYSVYQPEPTWLPAPDSKPPELADAQMVEWVDMDGTTLHQEPAFQVPWSSKYMKGLRYRPLYSLAGHALCSAEGLEEWAEFVATQANGVPCQWESQPHVEGLHWEEPDYRANEAPNSHRRPGPWSESLMEVMR